MSVEQLSGPAAAPEVDRPASDELLYFTTIYNFYRTEGSFDQVRCEKDGNLMDFLYEKYGRAAIRLESPLDEYGEPVQSELEVYIQADVLQAACRDFDNEL